MGALGYAIAEPIINIAVDAYISPRGLKALLAGSQPQQGDNSGDQDSGLPSRNSDDAKVNASYKSLNLFVVTASDASDSASGQVVRFNFERSEIVNWKLTSLTLP